MYTIKSTISFKDGIDRMENMNIGDRVAPSNNVTVVRVIGGWVYSDLTGCCFIPLPPYMSAKAQA